MRGFGKPVGRPQGGRADTCSVRTEVAREEEKADDEDDDAETAEVEVLGG
jgi:hypothetical protein